MSATVVLGATIVLAGWTLSLPSLTTFGAAGVGMNPLSAICLLLLGAALLVTLPVPHGAIEARAGRALALTAAALSLAKLATLSSQSGPDAWVFHRAVNAVTPVNRMAPNTALILLPVAIAVASLDVEIRGRRLAPLFIAAALPLTLVVAVGFVFGVSELYGWGAFIPMAAATAVGLLLLQLAVLAGRVEHG